MKLKVLLATLIVSFCVFAENLLKNPGFEEVKDGKCAGWGNYDGGYALDAGIRRSGRYSVCFEQNGHCAGTGVRQHIVFEKPDMLPVVFGGWSLSEYARAHRYCVYLDIRYADGTAEWGKQSGWHQGKHSWQKTFNVFYPRKPVKKITFFVFIKNGVGKVWVDDVFVERREVETDVRFVEAFTERPLLHKTTLHVDFTRSVGWKIKGDGGLNVRSGKGSAATFMVDEDEKILTLLLDDGKSEKEVLIDIPEIKLDRNPIPSGSVAVWTATSMDFITPLTFPTKKISRHKRKSGWNWRATSMKTLRFY